MSLVRAIRTRFHPLWRIRQMPRLHHFISRFDFPVWVRLAETGTAMRVYWFRDLPWLFDSVPKEPAVVAVVEQICREFRPRIFWDVGANLGWYTWLVNARTQLESALAIEPLPGNARLLRETIARNRFAHIEVLESAVADRVGTVEFIVDTKSGATSQLQELFARSDQSAIAHVYDLRARVQVNCTTLDELLARGYAMPDLLKLDVEEAEHLALKGAQRLLAEARTIVVLECHQISALQMLRDAHYRVFALDELHNYVAVPQPFAERAAVITSGLVEAR